MRAGPRLTLHLQMGVRCVVGRMWMAVRVCACQPESPHQRAHAACMHTATHRCARREVLPPPRHSDVTRASIARLGLPMCGAGHHSAATHCAGASVVVLPSSLDTGTVPDTARTCTGPTTAAPPRASGYAAPAGARLGTCRPPPDVASADGSALRRWPHVDGSARACVSARVTPPTRACCMHAHSTVPMRPQRSTSSATPLRRH